MNARQLMIMSHGYRAIAESAQYFLDHNLDRSSDYLAPAIESVERNRALASLATKYWSRQYKLEQKDTHESL
jgi:DNA-binding phage protein